MTGASLAHHPLLTDIEADLERELGRGHVAQLRELLMELNASAFVRGSHDAPRSAST